MNKTLMWVLVGALVLFFVYRMRRPQTPVDPAPEPEESVIDSFLRQIREATRRIGLDEAEVSYYDAPAPGITRRVSRLGTKAMVVIPEGGGKADRGSCCDACAGRR